MCVGLHINLICQPKLKEKRMQVNFKTFKKDIKFNFKLRSGATWAYNGKVASLYVNRENEAEKFSQIWRVLKNKIHFEK